VQAGSLKPLKENLWLYAKAFHRQGDFIPRHNLPYNPLLDPITGGLAGIGMLLLLWRFYGFGERALLIAFALGMIGGVFSARLEAPNTFRIGMAGPIVCLIAALPLASLCAVRDRKKDERSPQRWTLIFVAVLGIIAMEFNYERYFKEFPCQETWIGSMGQVQDLIYRQITPQDLGPERLFVYHGFATRTFKLYMYFLDVEKNGKDAKFSTTLYTMMDLKTYVPPLASGENIFVMPPDYEDLMKEKIPGIEVEILKNPYGVAEVALGRIEKK